MPESSDKGGRKPRVTDSDILDVFEATGDPVLSTAEVAEALPIKRRGVLNRLRDLEADGQLKSKQIGGRNTVWWPPSTPSEPAGGETARETPEEGGEGEPDPTPTEPGEPESDDTTAETGLAEELREYLEETGQNPQTPHGRGVVVDVFKALREEGTLSTGDLQDRIYPAYSDHWGSARTMWNAVDRYLEEIPGIEKAGYGEWGYTGDESVRDALDDVQTDSGVYDPTEEF
jgi:hypothetical protein